MSIKFIALAILVSAFWGLDFVAAKFVMREIPAFAGLAIRLFAIGLVLIPLYPKPPLPLLQLMFLAFIGIVLHIGGIFGGLAMGVGASMATLVAQVNVPFMLILNLLVYKERFGIKSCVGLLLAAIGLFLLLQSPSAGGAFAGIILIMGAAFFWSVYSLMLKRHKDIHPLALMGWVFFLAAPMIALLSFVVEEQQIRAVASASFSSWLALAYGTVCASIAGNGLWCYLVSRAPIDKLAPITLLVPFFGVVGGVLFLGETVSEKMLLGAVIMLAGLAIILIRKPVKTVEHL